MSNMAEISQLTEMSVQLPIDWYVDPKILEIEKNVTDEEVKKAYRRMAVKYHPDKVAHLGEEFQKAAKEKFQKVQEAYDKIKNERGMN